jgi:hypothetical protein
LENREEREQKKGWRKKKTDEAKQKDLSAGSKRKFTDLSTNWQSKRQALANRTSSISHEVNCRGEVPTRNATTVDEDKGNQGAEVCMPTGKASRDQFLKERQDFYKKRRPHLGLVTSLLTDHPDPYPRVLRCQKVIPRSLRVCSHGWPGSASKNSQVFASSQVLTIAWVDTSTYKYTHKYPCKIHIFYFILSHLRATLLVKLWYYSGDMFVS